MAAPDVLEALLCAVDDVNEQLPPQRRLARSGQVAIAGDGAELDSMGLVSLLIAADDRLCQILDEPISLVETLLGGETGSVPETLAELAARVASQHGEGLGSADL